jgi:hypothetical protein
MLAGLRPAAVSISASASKKGTDSSSASARPTLVLPAPIMPINTTERVRESFFGSDLFMP